MMINHHTILNGQKRPRLVPNMSWNDSKPCQEISQLTHKWTKDGPQMVPTSLKQAKMV